MVHSDTARVSDRQSRASDARAAVRSSTPQVAQPDTALVIFFCSDEYDLAILAPR